MIGTKPAAAAAVRLPPVGFWSYSRQDDELSGGKLSQLRALLVAEIQQQIGRETVRLFQDVSTIPHGAEWEREIRTSIQEATFFIPIVTPNSIQSEWCSTELLMFLEREQELGAQYRDLPRRSRIFPIQFIDIGGVDPHDPRVLAALEQRQTFDFRGLRYRNFQDESVQQALGEFATSIRRALQLKVHPAPAEAPPAPAATPPPAAAMAPAPIVAAAAPVQPAPPPESDTPRAAGWLGKPIAWAALALVALSAAGAVYLASGDPEPSVAPAEPAPRTATAAPAAAPPASGGGWEQWKAQVDRWTAEQQARAEAEPDARPAEAEEAAATPEDDDGAACARLYRQARTGSPSQEVAGLRRYLGQCTSGDDRAAAERRLAELGRYREAIQRVLAEDRRGGSGSPEAVFLRVRSIDTSGAPPEFRRAYADHVAAWRDRAALERRPAGPGRPARIAAVEQRVRSTYERAAAIAARYGAR